MNEATRLLVAVGLSSAPTKYWRNDFQPEFSYAIKRAQREDADRLSAATLMGSQMALGANIGERSPPS